MYTNDHFMYIQHLSGKEKRINHESFPEIQKSVAKYPHYTYNKIEYLFLLRQ